MHLKGIKDQLKFDAETKKEKATKRDAKMEPKPSKITPKMDPKEANRALQKGKDFNRGKQWKKQRKTTS